MYASSSSLTERTTVSQPRPPEEVNTGIDKASAAIKDGDAAIAAHLLGVRAVDVKRVSGSTK
jgi:hypothetical protein